jgi:hypothetical protein
MADVNDVLQIELGGHCSEIVRIMIHVMTVAGLGRAAVTAPVMGDNAIAAVEEEQHLRIPVVGRQWPTVTEHDGLTFAPVLVENLDAVFRCDKAHDVFLSPRRRCSSVTP